MILTFAIGSLATIALIPASHPPLRVNAPPAISPAVKVPASFRDVLSLTADETANIDIARLNLLCALDLPGSQDLDIDALVATLDDWARRVRFDTDRHLYRFAQNPGDFERSEPFYRMSMLTTVIQQDFNVRYNPERARDPDFRDSRDLFIHGLLSAPHAGTCMSMPVLAVAVGRRLGYPLRLASAKSHLYVRWDDPSGTHLNFGATSRGVMMYDDGYYADWPEPLNEMELASGAFLRGLTPAEELATFLQARGHCLEDIGRLAEAQVCYAHAHALFPTFPYGIAFLAEAVRKDGGLIGRSDRSFENSIRREPAPWEMLRLADEINARNAQRLRSHTPAHLLPEISAFGKPGGLP